LFEDEMSQRDISTWRLRVKGYPFIRERNRKELREIQKIIFMIIMLVFDQEKMGQMRGQI
jgi:hypothetical protein